MPTLDIFEKSAKGGDAYGQYMLGMMYLGGIGVDTDIKKARAWLQKSAAQGYQDAQAALDAL